MWIILTSEVLRPCVVSYEEQEDEPRGYFNTHFLSLHGRIYVVRINARSPHESWARNASLDIRSLWRALHTAYIPSP